MPNPLSPFHSGESAVQERVGVYERMDSIGHRIIHDHMPEEHRAFFAMLPSLFVAGADDAGRIWGSVLVGPPGFVTAQGPRLLHIRTRLSPADPLAAAWHDGAAIGCLGIELHRRRRSRVNGIITLGPSDGSPNDSFTLAVTQSFGNCRQYITARQPDYQHLQLLQARPHVRHLTRLDQQAAQLIARADTFFIASSDGRKGADMSHRGGPPGFITLQGEHTLIWPDYLGNFFFNTLGNLAVNPRCGLLIMDFTSGDTLQVSGQAEVLWQWDVGNPAFAGAQRLLQFNIETAVGMSSSSGGLGGGGR